MLLQVHDELVFDVWKEELEFVKFTVENRMKYAIPSLNVPMEVGIRYRKELAGGALNRIKPLRF